MSRFSRGSLRWISPVPYAYGASGVQPMQRRRSELLRLPRQGQRPVTVGHGPGRHHRQRTRQSGSEAGKVDEAEMGFESRIFTNRVNFDFTYYNKKTSDALVEQADRPVVRCVRHERVDEPRFGAEHGHLRPSSRRRSSTPPVRLGHDDPAHRTAPTRFSRSYGPNGYCSATITTACDSVGTGTTRKIKGKPVNGPILRAVQLSPMRKRNGIITPDEVTVGRRRLEMARSIRRRRVVHGLFESARHRCGLNGFDLFQRKLQSTSSWTTRADSACSTARPVIASRRTSVTT